MSTNVLLILGWLVVLLLVVAAGLKGPQGQLLLQQLLDPTDSQQE